MIDAALPDLSSRADLGEDAFHQYQRDGHLLVRGVATGAELRPYRSAITQALESFRFGSAPLEERDTYGKAFLQKPNLWQFDSIVENFVHARRFASIAAQLLGVERVRVFQDQALFKEPGGGITPWHQDAMYWPLDGSRCVTMWMPLIDIVPEMGALTFASGSHVSGPLSDLHISDASEGYFDGLLSDGRWPLSEPVPMDAGDATFHSGWTVHKATGNSTGIMRSVMTIIYFADGLTVLEPANPAQQLDLETWLPGLRPGDLAATALNRVVG